MINLQTSHWGFAQIDCTADNEPTFKETELQRNARYFTEVN